MVRFAGTKVVDDGKRISGYPVNGLITGVFRATTGYWKGASPHSGLDIAAPTGTPIHAAAGGIVQPFEHNPAFGLWTRVAHDDGTYTAYAHMSEQNPDLKWGQRIEAGEVLGYVGMTGKATGPHVHWALSKDGNFPKYKRGGPLMDPLSKVPKRAEMVVAVKPPPTPVRRMAPKLSPAKKKAVTSPVRGKGGILGAVFAGLTTLTATAAGHLDQISGDAIELVRDADPTFVVIVGVALVATPMIVGSIPDWLAALGRRHESEVVEEWLEFLANEYGEDVRPFLEDLDDTVKETLMTAAETRFRQAVNG